MYSRADQHRREAMKAQGRAAQATDPSVKLAFEEVANNWLALADEAEWLERQMLIPPAEAPGPAVQEQQKIQAKED
jgi:hypothetical protein